jgi:SAM-dependent methyltransferase
MPDPVTWVALWRRRMDRHGELARQQLAALEAQQGDASALASTRRRLGRVSVGLKEQHEKLAEHFDRLGAQTQTGHAAAQQLASAFTSPGGASAVLKCYENLFRDWSWGEGEAAQSLELVRRLAPPSLGKLAVYGAGAGRLAVDVHTRLEPACTVAVDLNPVPLLVASRLARGEAVALPEFPVGPHSEADVVVQQTLRCSATVDARFSWAFADVLRPPFSAGAFDTVLTSWLVDAVDASLDSIVAAIQRVLRPGGIWINLGPLRFDGPLREAYSIGEALETVEQSGFELGSRFTHAVDYFHSPHSGTRRQEMLFCFAARNARSSSAPYQPGVRAPWRLDPNRAIPSSPAMQALRRQSVLTSGVLSLVDGKRSLSNIAQLLGAQWRLPPEALLDMLREFFTPLVER